jgi:hypothetical protein
MASTTLPSGPQELTAGWLTAALRETDTIGEGVSVESFETESIAEGVGLLGQLARVTLRYADTSGSEPATLIAKFPAATQENRDMANALRFYDREVRFYEQIADDVELRTPKRYFSHFDAESGTFVLLIEDMHPARVGNQIEGCAPEEAQSTLERIAHFHATWWDKPETRALDWVPYGKDEVHNFVEESFQKSWPVVKENFPSHLSDRIVRAAEKMQTRLIRMQHIFSEPPITICHGDLRYDNLFFSDDGMAVADWQIVLRGRAPYDAAYFMSQSVNPEDRRASEMEILRAYHDVLVDAGVRDYSFERCLEDYRFAAMYCLVYPVISAGSLDLANERGVALATAMLDRSVSTILDLDCDEKIPD